MFVHAASGWLIWPLASLLRALTPAVVMAGLCDAVGGVGALAGQAVSQEVIGRYQGQAYLIQSPAPDRAPPPSGWPIMVFLHGYSERGLDVRKLRYNNTPPGRYAALEVLHRNVVLIAPQLASSERFWDPVWLRALLHHALDGWLVDWSRLSLTGLSIGGTGVWDFATHFPDEVAAAVSFGGVARQTIVDPFERPFTFDYEAPVLEASQRADPALKRVPFMEVHCKADIFIPFRAAARMVLALRSLGNDKARIIPVPDCGHGSWTRYYKLERTLPGRREVSLYDWLLDPQN
jgi:pimeloyl-ACP methyl ester carboxylesterase